MSTLQTKRTVSICKQFNNSKIILETYLHLLVFITASSNGEGPGCSSWSNQRARQRLLASDVLPSEFSFSVPWKSLSRSNLDSLDEREFRKERATPDEESELRLGIVKKLINDYNAYKDRSLKTLQKHPGLKVYRKVVKQVIFIKNMMVLSF